VLLGHARLYCFADKYGIVLLKQLCRKAVEAALVDLECQQGQVDVLAQLIRFVIGNTPSTGIQHDRDLRTVVLEYAAIVFEVLIENATFKDLLCENHDLCVELLLLLGKRLD